MTPFARLIAVAALCVGSSACMNAFDPQWGSRDRADAPMSPTFGRALASMDNQIIDPTPAAGLPATSAAKAASAIGRYERGQVIQPAAASGAAASGDASDQSAPETSGEPK